jgi:hypothetical protein
MVRIDAIETYQRAHLQDNGGVCGCQLTAGLAAILRGFRSQAKPPVRFLFFLCLVRVMDVGENGFVDSKGLRWVRFFAFFGCRRRRDDDRAWFGILDAALHGHSMSLVGGIFGFWG